MHVCTFLNYIQDGVTPLHFACENGHDEVVKILLQGGADPNIQDKVNNRDTTRILPV